MFRLLFFLFISFAINAQAQTCDSLVPKFYVDFTGDSAGTTWTTYSSRLGFCCSASGFDRCIEFIVFTDSSTAAISFQTYVLPFPGGPMYYQVDCGPMLITGTDTSQITACGSHCVTFCRPGNSLIGCAITSVLNPNPTNCSAYSQCSDLTSVVEQNSKSQISLFPNPFSYSATFKTNLGFGELIIYNSLGLFVRREPIKNVSTIIARNSLIDGIYFYRFITKSGHVATGKFVVD